ncbi:MAG: N-acetylneuraminate synthase family protein [Nitrospirae bacterium]|nr:N-acetylneuraminate synthase family protein [Nitrospirota bacterium]
MAWAHDGSLEKAIQIMKGAKKAGADAIGIHVTNVESYMVPYYGNGEGKVSAGRESMDIYNYLLNINLSHDDWLRFAEETRKEGILLCVMPNDMNSLAFVSKQLSPDIYVVPSASFVEEEFLKTVAKQKRKTMFRIGGATVGEIEKVINLFRVQGNEDIVLLHGIQMYPTNIEDTNIAIIASLKSMFNVEVGLADHIDGGTMMAKAIPLLAIPFGASCIEKHITLNRDEKGEDFESALNPSDFKEFVDLVRGVEIAIGRGYMGALRDSDLRYRNIVRKKIVAATDIAATTVITHSDVTFKRCDVGITPDMCDMVFGRVAAVDIRKDDVITLDKLKGCLL